MRRIKEEKIPEDDLKAINDSFSGGVRSQTITKDAFGRKKSAEKEVVNEKTIKFSSFIGRKLSGHMSVVLRGGGQIVVGVKGQLWDDIPLDKRNMIVWKESDFEPSARRK